MLKSEIVVLALGIVRRAASAAATRPSEQKPPRRPAARRECERVARVRLLLPARVCKDASACCASVRVGQRIMSKEYRVKSRTPTRDRAGRGPTRTRDPAAHIRGFGRRGGGRRETHHTHERAHCSRGTRTRRRFALAGVCARITYVWWVSPLPPPLLPDMLRSRAVRVGPVPARSRACGVCGMQFTTQYSLPFTKHKDGRSEPSRRTATGSGGTATVVGATTNNNNMYMCMYMHM